MQKLDFTGNRELIKWKLVLKHAISRPGFPLSSRLPSNVSQHFRLLMHVFEKCSPDQRIHFSFPP